MLRGCCPTVGVLAEQLNEILFTYQAPDQLHIRLRHRLPPFLGEAFGGSAALDRLRHRLPPFLGEAFLRHRLLPLLGEAFGGSTGLVDVGVAGYPNAMPFTHCIPAHAVRRT